MGVNAQTAVPAFVAGEILTAAEMTQINTGVPVFATTTTRDAAFGGTGEKVLAQGQYAYIEATNALQVYNGSAWVAGAGSLIRVTGGTLSGGTVLFSNAFNSTYDAYRIVVSNFTNTTSAYVYMTLGSAATGYVNFQSAVTPAGAFSTTFGGQGTTRWAVAFATTTDSGFAVDVFNPNLAKRTTISGGLLVNGSTEAGTMVGTLTDTTQYTSFTLTANSGTFTGTVNVYGYSLS